MKNARVIPLLTELSLVLYHYKQWNQHYHSLRNICSILYMWHFITFSWETGRWGHKLCQESDPSLGYSASWWQSLASALPIHDQANTPVSAIGRYLSCVTWWTGATLSHPSARTAPQILGSQHCWKFSGWGKLPMHWLDGQSALSRARAHTADRQQCAITFVSSVLQAPAPRPQKMKIDQKPLPEAFTQNHIQSLHLVLLSSCSPSLAEASCCSTMDIPPIPCCWIKTVESFLSYTTQSYPKDGVIHL